MRSFRVNSVQFTEGISGITFLSLLSSDSCLFSSFPACFGLVAGGSLIGRWDCQLLPGSRAELALGSYRVIYTGIKTAAVGAYVY